ERNGTERNGTERNGTERNGTERNGTERNGTDKDKIENSKYCLKFDFAKKIFLIILFLVFASYGQQQKRIAIINTLDDGEPQIKPSELIHLTNRLREIANDVLPQKGYAVMTMQSIVSFLGSEEEASRRCKETEGCLAQLGREVNADYVSQARIGRFNENLTINAELYASGSGNLVSSFTGEAKDILGLLAVINEKASSMFGKMPSVSGGKAGSSIIFGGISGVQSSEGYGFDVEKSYLVNLSTNPTGANLSFNGVPAASCNKTPCKVELPGGKVRIIAVLEQYETTDTTISVERNNQSVEIFLKPKFGVLKIEQAYLDGMGERSQWNLVINGKPYGFGKIRLSPGEYTIELSHECYEAISFKAGINKGKSEVFDMTSHMKPKLGGLQLSAERDDELSSEPVYVNGKKAGETPFSGTVAVCSKIELGEEMDLAEVKLKYNQIVKYKHKMPYSSAWVSRTAEARSKKTTADMEVEAEQTRDQIQRIKLGFRIAGGLTITPSGSSPEWFDAYDAGINYKNIGTAEMGGNPGGLFELGLTLNIWPFSVMALVAELNYSFFTANYCWGGEECGDSKDYIIWTRIYNHSLNIPVLLRLGKRDVFYFEAGYQWGFPFYSYVWPRKGDDFNPEGSVEYPKSRMQNNQALVFGFGIQNSELIFGLRFTYYLTEFDRHNTLKSPVAIGIQMGSYFERGTSRYTGRFNGFD
ncbi:MAG: PEGA domain-containing protein, partial [Fibromonadales bacterium]|nr:PEGA domain-containing protein [Fibromonadales bacterium]